MKCPFCGFLDTFVRDSRPINDSSAIRRKRFCSNCGGRFLTFERMEAHEMLVLKKNGVKKSFDRAKLLKSLTIATRKRPIEPEDLENIANNIVKNLEKLGELEVNSIKIGELAMDELAMLDKVAYVRYASVYKDFHDVEDFVKFVNAIGSDKQT